MENTKKQNIKKPSFLNTIRSIPEAWRTRKSILGRKNLLKKSEGNQNNRNKLFKNTKSILNYKPILSGTNNSNLFSTIPSKTNNNNNNNMNINNTNINIPKSPYLSLAFRKRTTRKQKRYNRKK